MNTPKSIHEAIQIGLMGVSPTNEIEKEVTRFLARKFTPAIVLLSKNPESLKIVEDLWEQVSGKKIKEQVWQNNHPKP